MYLPNCFQQISFFDSFEELPDYLKRYLLKSWAHPFQEVIFPAINEDRFAALYSDKPSRPNSYVNVIIGGLIIKELFDLNDEQLVASIHMNLKFQYALRLTSEERPPVSKNTFTNFRKRVTEYYEETGQDLIQQEVESLADLIAEELEIEKEMARIDSFMVASACRNLSRIELVYKVNENFIKMLNKTSPHLIPEELEVYLSEEHKNEVIYQTKNSEAETKLERLLEQAKELYDIALNAESPVTDSEEFELLKRMLQDQTKDKDDFDNIEPKEGKDISPDSLQNPSDPDATYRHKYDDNTGYVGSVVEYFNGENSVIITYDFKPNIYSDQKFSQNAIEKLAPENEGKEDINQDTTDDNKDVEKLAEDSDFLKLLMDGTYYSFDLASKALSRGIRFIPGELTGRKPAQDKMTFYENFDLDDSRDKITGCAAGREPDYQEAKDNGDYYATFDKGVCENCKLLDECRINLMKSHGSISFSENDYESGRLRKQMGTKEYNKLTNQRAGIEGVPSALRRSYNVDNMPVMGLVRQKFFFSFKIAALNFRKYLKGYLNGKEPALT